MENERLKPSGPLEKCGLSDKWSKDYYTFFSRIQFPDGKTVQQFYEHINDGMCKLEDLRESRRIRLKMVAIVFGEGDAFIIWQAKDPKAARQFRDTILADQAHTSVALSGDGHNG